MCIRKLIFVLILSCSIKQLFAHGRLELPAARNSAWRFGFNTPQNYNDNELNCGGAGQQHATNGGKCGVCGDSYNGLRLHEAGGKFATGTIVQSYLMGQIIDVRVRLSANHKGTMEFRLCPVTSKYVEVTFECLDRHLMEIVGYGTSYPVKTGESEINLNVKLPDGLTCSQCVFQWKYRAGNNWGSLPNGTSGPGYGPQEEFYNCADIEIVQNALIEPSSTAILPNPTTTTAIYIPDSTSVITTRFTRPSYRTRTSRRPTTSKTTTTIATTTTIKTTTTTTTTSRKTPFPTKISTNNMVIEPFFHCEKISSDIADKLPKTPDPNEFNGVPLCLLVGDSQLTCKDCYENCISPLKKCPKQFCYCRWYT